uniref:Uncharacterized protein n=1 Tax=Avena sativa TaxID=4498 RepID=A0ACD5XWD4_AVESA
MGNSYGNGGSSTTSASGQHLQAPELPLHLCFFLLVLSVFLGFSWYMSYESVAETFADQGRILLMVSPLALLLAVRLLSGADNNGDGGHGQGHGRRVDQLMSMSMPERDSIHRAGGSPWGVGLLLLLLIVMVSYQSNFRDRWFAI